MSIVNKILGGLFGNKSEKDISEVQPLLIKINEETDRIVKLNNDQLREETTKIKNRINEYVREERDEISSIKEKIESGEIDVDEVEKLYDRIDKIEKEIDVKLEQVMLEVLPVAFAIIKETSSRFKTNEKLEVAAQEYDRDLAVVHDNIEIQGDKAYWHNKWMAGGNLITWDMIHYDVQLVGGIV